MGTVLKRVLDMSICLFNQCGCLRHDKEHSLREFYRQFKVCGEIGSGGFGRVYKAYRLADGLPVAVKSIRYKRVNGWTLAERRMIPTEICFIEECQDVQGVVRLIGWFANRNGFLIVMERPTNFMDLFDLISTFGWLEERMARGLFVQIVDTVVELYKKHSVIHRDIKDENVVVNLDSGTVWLVDFGAAELLERAKKQRFQGTLSYSPPEVFSRDCYYPLEGTVWSLGILLYLLVVGKPPFRNELQICTGKLRFPRTVSSECRALIRRCLCPNPEGRISLEELQQNEWIRYTDAVDTFFSNFEAQWRRRKRNGSQNSNGLHALSDGEEDDDEDCSYRTEAGAVPGPLTIPSKFGGGTSVAHRSTTTTSSSFMEQQMNNSHSEEVVEVPNDQNEQNPTAQLAPTTDSPSSYRSSSSSLAMSGFGFETAPEYDDWKYVSFCSNASAAEELVTCEFFDKNGTFQQQNFPPNHQFSIIRHQRNAPPANSVVIPLLFPHGFRATQSDGGSARSSFCSFSSSSADDRETFTSDDSFTSSTTYFSANSRENPLLLHLTSSYVVIDENGEKSEDEDDERTLRTEQPQAGIMEKEWRREISEEEEEWDETIRKNIGFYGGKESDEKTREEEFEEDELLEEGELLEKGQMLMNANEPPKEGEQFEKDELVEKEERSEDDQTIEWDELLEKDGSASASPSSSTKGEKEPKAKEIAMETQKLADELEKQNCPAQRKGGDRYRRRRISAQTMEVPRRNFGGRRRRLTSPPEQTNYNETTKRTNL